MVSTKLNIGKIPISKGEYQEGIAYQRLNQVTMLGSTYQSKIDDNTSAPAQMGADGAVENINTEKWLCIAVGNISSAKKVVYNNETSGLEAGNVQEAIDEVSNKTSQILSTDNIDKYATLFIDSNGYIGIALTKDGKSLFDEDTNQFNAKIADDAIIKTILLIINKILENICFEANKSGFVDTNGNAALYADNQGVHLANVVSHDVLGRTAVVDTNGNAAFIIDKNGKIKGNFDNIPRKIIIGDYSYSANNEIIQIPTNLFTYNSAKLMLPSKIPYVVGQQMHVYYESILLNGFTKDFTIYSRSSQEAQQKECKIYHEVVRKDDIHFKLENSFGNLIETKTTHVVVLDKEKVGSLKICVVGDSKSDNNTKQAEILNLCQKDGNLTVQFVGAFENRIGYDSDDNKRTFANCAISGSGIPDWCCGKTIASRENPFYDESVESGITVTMRTNTGNYNNSPIKFSIEKAISKIGDFDILWIDHGANQQSNEETFKCYDYIISDVKRYNKEKGKNIKVVISVQEGFSLVPTYDSVITNIRSKDGLYRANNYITKYDNMENEGIFICPQYLNVDLWNDFPCTMVYQNSRNKDVDKKVCLDPIHPGVNTGTYSSSTQYHAGNILAVGSGLNRERNMYLSLTDNLGVEPNDDKIHWAKATNSLNSGYYKIADMYYATIRYILSLT